jgi:hypothetical protein
MLNSKAKGNKMSYNLKGRREAEELVKALVDALYARQEARGENLDALAPYTLGYVGSVLAGILADSPKARKSVKDTLKFVKESK